MPSISDSQVILYLVIAVSILGLTIFICWAIFYLAMILKQSFKVVKEMRERWHKVDTVIDSLKEKIEHSASYLLLIGEGVRKLVEVIRERSEKKKTTSRRTKTGE